MPIFHSIAWNLVWGCKPIAIIITNRVPKLMTDFWQRTFYLVKGQDEWFMSAAFKNIGQLMQERKPVMMIYSGGTRFNNTFQKWNGQTAHEKVTE